MADDKPTPYVKTTLDMELRELLIEVRDGMRIMDNKIDDAVNKRDTIQVVNQVVHNVAEKSKESWLDPKNRPSPKYELKCSSNARVRFRTACRECIGVFERYYIPEIGDKYTKYDEETYKFMIEEIFDEIKKDKVKLTRLEAFLKKLFA
ncbi:hypothetical protein D5b_00028 [Faustovirus]|nr:hypothetical protein D5b_00028 [Faustovirus]AMN84881.1 hypothetical protein D6_00482 [Faustovirus]AMP43987.1 hypothetical protein PRJ_Dakar_00027 [Faustovirus]